MATNEGDFKLEFKIDLKKYLPNAVIWSNSDKYTSGLPDFCIVHDKHFVAIEAKFIKELPKRATSKVLSHEVSAAQKLFLEKVLENKQAAFVVIGSPQAAVVFSKIQSNYSKEECLTTARILKNNGKWDVEGFCELWR